MTDTNAPPPASDEPAPKTWPDAGIMLLHYLAGAVILYFAYQGMIAGKVDGQLFAVLVSGAAAAVGFKMSK